MGRVAESAASGQGHRTDTGWAFGSALVFALGLIGVLAALNSAQGRPWDFLAPRTLPGPLVLVLALQVLGTLGEDLGWRGVVEPLLETRCSVLWAGVVTGLLFGLGHFYVAAAGIAVYLVFVLSAVGLSVTLAVLTAGRSLMARVGLATCFHWSVNTGLLLVFSDGDESLRWTVDSAVASIVVAAVAVAVAGRRHRSVGGRLGRQISGE